MNLDAMLIKRGDVFFSYLGLGEGSEQSGWRPVVVCSNNTANKYSPVLIVAPITTKKINKQLPTHVYIEQDMMGLEKDSIVLTEQLITIDKSRLLMPGSRYLCRLRRADVEKISRALETSVGLIMPNEREVFQQLEVLKRSEYHLNELMEYPNIPKSIISQASIKYEFEYRKLEKLCKENYLYMDNYYNKSLDMGLQHGIKVVI